jgi:hypothetical protein
MTNQKEGGMHNFELLRGEGRFSLLGWLLPPPALPLFCLSFYMLRNPSPYFTK